MDVNDQLLTMTHLGDEYGKYLHAVVPPVFLTSLHVYDQFEDYLGAGSQEEGYVYGRCANPTTHLLEKKLAALENGAEAAVFSSGMAAATSAILATCQSGDHILCMRDVYQPIKRFMAGIGTPRLHMEISFVTGLDLAEVEAAIRPNTKLMILESPATFVFTVVDLAGIAEICRRHGVKTYIDNTCATPLYQNPLDFGIDIVMHTLSKYLGGHSDVIGGVLVSKDADLIRYIVKNTREWFGGILGPMESWLVIRGVRTLGARLAQHQDTALKVAAFLEAHEKVSRVYYTGLASHPQAALIQKQMRGHTGLMSFTIKGTPAQAVEVINHLKLFGKGCSWGGFESLALCPLFTATDEEMQFLNLCDRGLIRIHCGLEGADNLIADLAQALEKI
ncbi:MAG: PLP-dependent aspartate aminotransferase family protein [Clostridia bacterium]